MHGTRPRPRFGFDRVIAPVAREEFLSETYEAAPLVLHRGDAAYYDDLLTLDEVWRHIETRCPGPPDINLVKFGATQQADDWVGSNRRADPVRVARMFGEGWTISLNKMQEHLPPLGALCAAAEAVFSCPFQTNLYLTPPGAQGFMPHWDTHDVFVMQVHGSKGWTLYDTKIELPLVGQSFDIDKPAPGEVSDAFTLRAGDMLYCPRGLMHSAQSGPDVSLHVTFGLMGKTWSDLVLEAVSKLFLEEPGLRRNLPVGFAGADFDAGEAAAVFRGLMATVAERADFEGALAGMRERFVTGRTVRMPGLAAGIEGLEAVGVGTRVAVRADLVWFLEMGKGSVSLCCGGSVVTLPGFAEAAVRAAMVPGGFVVGALPGPLDEAGKVTLVRRMIREGLLEAF